MELGDLLDKITSYNLFNYLLPGAVFAFLADRYFAAGFIGENLVVAAFVFYFFGVLVSRIGSLVVEPAFQKAGLVKFESYADFLAASVSDQKIDTLMEAANMYRTFAALFLLLILFGAYQQLEAKFPWIEVWRGLIACVFLFLLFALSYVKQISYVRQRITKSATK